MNVLGEEIGIGIVSPDKKGVLKGILNDVWTSSVAVNGNRNIFLLVWVSKISIDVKRFSILVGNIFEVDVNHAHEISIL